MKRFYIAGDIAQAQLVVNMLEQALIPARIQNLHQSGGLGELAVTYPEVWLERDQDQARARRLVEQFEARGQLPEQDRVCPGCRENNPAGFDLCWACGADLD